MNAAVDLALEQAGGLQDAEMFGDSGERNVKRSSEFGDSGFALGQTDEDGSAGGVGQGAESGVQNAGRIVNHTVYYRTVVLRRQEDCQNRRWKRKGDRPWPRDQCLFAGGTPFDRPMARGQNGQTMGRWETSAREPKRRASF
jgi:hypothetical protein